MEHNTRNDRFSPTVILSGGDPDKVIATMGDPNLSIETILQNKKGPKPGRPTSLTLERYNKIIELIKHGSPQVVAASVSGIHEDTFGRWMQQGERDLRNNEPNTLFARFFRDVNLARNYVENELANHWKKIVTEGTKKVVNIYKTKVSFDEDGNEVSREKVFDSSKEEVIGAGDWKGIAEFLLRRYPERWSRNENLSVTGANGGPIQIDAQSVHIIDQLPTEIKQLILLSVDGGVPADVLQYLRDKLKDVAMSDENRQALEMSNKDGQYQLDDDHTDSDYNDIDNDLTDGDSDNGTDSDLTDNDTDMTCSDANNSVDMPEKEEYHPVQDRSEKARKSDRKCSVRIYRP